MTTIIRNKDVVIENPQLKPIYTPFVAEPGLMAGWRFGNGMVDLSGNGNTLTAIGVPTVDSFFISGDKDNGYKSSVPDGYQRTLVAIWRNHSTTDAYAYPVGNLAQSSSSQGIGLGLKSNSSSSSNLSRISGNAGGNTTTSSLLAIADGPTDTYANRLNFRWAAFTIDGAGNAANLFVPAMNTALIPATLASGANLGTREITEGGVSSMYRLIAYRNPAIPASLPGSAIDVAEVLIFDRALDLAALQRTYQRSKQYMSLYGQTI
ncbi:hypothetical protein HVX57_18765 [Klebsiella michiganensis]|uniref:hypothetical protein n=1 Tax=Klebsiella michiganensis TaxID=1134687 RepID=UPI0015E53D99|nr:hypothetical protein [Klebsiella michiganensis]MBA8302486.1 hypothetical protein [Klebsiella michiganensis]QLP37381.1 hypothetical protein HVX57_18765 [Klebsiella michiganensis]WFX45862.1 hypothetical protein NFK05_18830 [Klebsiella michiganensis]WFX51526.1 hypothetical protein NFK06_18825 [Klebsiella michiganensis]